MDKLFIGIVAVALLAILATPVFADTFPVVAGPINEPPQIYLLESRYDICGDDQWGGSRPYIPVDGMQDAQTDGCIELFDNIRLDEYAFTGEQISFLVAVRDLNGAPDIGYAFFTVGTDIGDQKEAVCNDVSGLYKQGDFFEQIPAKPFAPDGFNPGTLAMPGTDKIFECILTVEPTYYGESVITISAEDISGNQAENGGIAQMWFFNPAIIIDLSTNDGAPSITFESGYPGQTVMSTNKLVITNFAEGGVDLWAFIAADDLTDGTGGPAKCPVSNVLDVDTNMEFRCKIGTFEDDKWDDITNKDTSDSCGWGYHEHYYNCLQCLGALPLLYDFDGQVVDYLPGGASIIKNQASAECQFRLHYPVPCIGDFTEGAFHIIVRAL